MKYKMFIFIILTQKLIFIVCLFILLNNMAYIVNRLNNQDNSMKLNKILII